MRQTIIRSWVRIVPIVLVALVQHPHSIYHLELSLNVPLQIGLIIWVACLLANKLTHQAHCVRVVVIGGVLEGRVGVVPPVVWVDVSRLVRHPLVHS